MNSDLKKQTSLILFLYLACTAVALAFVPGTAHRFFVSQTAVFDAAHYLTISGRGYVVPSEPAFFPLWPVVLKCMRYVVPETQVELGACLLALAFFALSIPLLLKAFRQFMSPAMAMFCVLAFALNPNSLFHMLPYPESLFSFLVAMFLLITARSFQNGRSLALFAISALMSFCRPALVPLLFSVAVATTALYIRTSRFKQSLTGVFQAVRVSSVIIFGALVGYAVFGFHTAERMGSFWQPFRAQSYWDRKFGFHWELIYAPSSVSGSDNVRLWDMQAFYFPILLFLAGCYIRVLKTAAEPDASGESGTAAAGEYLFWFATCFALAHSIIAFFSYPIFMSLGRHVFSVPFVFFAGGMCLERFMEKPWTAKVLGAYAFVSGCFLVYWWSRYGRMGWIG